MIGWEQWEFTHRNSLLTPCLENLSGTPDVMEILIKAVIKQACINVLEHLIWHFIQNAKPRRNPPANPETAAAFRLAYK